MSAKIMSKGRGQSVSTTANGDSLEVANQLSVEQALTDGAVICYPTEAIFGLGCDPDNQAAVAHLLQLKGRPLSKGLILIADNYSQCLPYVADEHIPLHKRAEIFSSWPGAVTWLLPAKASAPRWLTGGRQTIAIRVTAHPVVKRICQAFAKPIVSTSANFSGEMPVTSLSQAKALVADQVGYYVDGPLGSHSSPSVIKDAMTGKVIRGT